MIINLIPDDSVAAAPAGFTSAVRSAADLIQQSFTDNITLHLRYGWGSWNNQPYSLLANTRAGVGGAVSIDHVQYSDLRSWLNAKPALPQDEGALASLPANPSSFPTNPDNHFGFAVASAEEKALGHFTGDTSAVDGAVGFGTATTPTQWYSLALHELTHAMGRESGVELSASTTDFPWALDLFRYSAPGTYQWSGTQPAYFSLDGGATNLANFDTFGDSGDFLSNSAAPDPFNDGVLFPNLTPLDLRVMDVIGFTPSPSNAIAVFDTTTRQSVPATGLAYSGPVAGLQHQYIYVGQDNVNVTVLDDNWFLHGGPGNDALAAHGGYNVLDGGTGSNFLSGGTGTDTFFVDDRGPPADIWSTVTAFHGGDDVTVFGVTPASANLQWFDNQGATGYTGLTLHATTPNQPTASLTLPGYAVSDLHNGRLTVAFGNEPDGTPFMHIAAS